MIAISKYNKQHPLRVFEAFAGYGSQSLAFKYLRDKHPEFDFKVVGYSEIEPSAIQAYGLLHGRDIPNFGDVTRIDWNEVPDFDFMSWSSPCQDFSNAGLRQGAEEGSGTRSSLIFQEKRMLAVKKPKYVITGGKRMKSLLISGKVKPDVGGQVLDIYNQAVMQGISPTIKTTIDTSNMTFVTIMNKEIIHTAPNGKKYSIQIRKYTPRDCFRLMGVHEADIISKEQTLCPRRKFNSNQLPDRHVRGTDIPLRNITTTTRLISYQSSSL